MSVAYNDDVLERKVCILYVYSIVIQNTNWNTSNLTASTLVTCRFIRSIFSSFVSVSTSLLYFLRLHNICIQEPSRKSAVAAQSRRTCNLEKVSSIERVESIAIFIPGALFIHNMMKNKVKRFNWCNFYHHFDRTPWIMIPSVWIKMREIEMKEASYFISSFLMK